MTKWLTCAYPKCQEHGLYWITTIRGEEQPFCATHHQQLAADQ